MKAITFQAPPDVLFEAGASSSLAETVAGYGVSVLLVTDKGVRSAGLTKGAEASLAKNGCALTVFDEADPPSHIIERAIGLCRDNKMELVASIGGGSALDTPRIRCIKHFCCGHFSESYAVKKSDTKTPSNPPKSS